MKLAANSKNTPCNGILIVEDDNDLRETIASVLQIEGVTVFTAANGKEALDILRLERPKPCLILLDLMMPVMSGWEFLAERRGRNGLRRIPVVVVSAFNKESVSGAETERVIGKPVNFDLLISIAKQYCGKVAA